MAATLHLEIVTPEKLAYSSDVESVVIPAAEGEMGVLPMHIPLMTQIRAGELVISKGGHKEYLAVGEGFVTVTQTSVNVLTDMAIEWEHIDEGAASGDQARPGSAGQQSQPRVRRSRRRAGGTLQEPRAAERQAPPAGLIRQALG